MHSFTGSRCYMVKSKLHWDVSRSIHTLRRGDIGGGSDGERERERERKRHTHTDIDRE